MKLISPFKSLIKGGVILNLKISAAGGENIQLDIFPQGKDSATGVALPPKALVGTADEIDAHLEDYLQKYAASVARIADVVANADAELKTIEDAAAAQAKKAVEDKSKAKIPASKPGTKAASAAARNKEMKAGLLSEDHDDDDDGNDDVEASTTLLTTGSSSETPVSDGAHAAAPAVTSAEGMSQDLFVV
jgi:PRTRC genetic system protein E